MYIVGIIGKEMGSNKERSEEVSHVQIMQSQSHKGFCFVLFVL